MNLSKLTARNVFLIVLVGTLPPLVAVLGLHISGFEILTGTTDSDKYYRPALRILETGQYGFTDSTSGQYRPYLDILPIYPYFLASIFTVFGKFNYLAVAVIQSLLQGGVVLAIGLTARNLRASWLWPAAILTALWPALAYRPTTILTETLFTFLFVWGLYALLSMGRARHVLPWALFAGVSLGLAYMTRPVFLLFPVILTPALIYLLRRSGGHAWIRSTGFAILPMLIMLAFTIPNYVLSFQTYGEPKFSIQKGYNALYYVYPCVAARWGCGEVDPTAAALARSELAEQLAALPESDRADPIILDNLRTAVAASLIRDLGLAQVIRGSVGSTLKLLLHNSSYEIMERFGNSPAYFQKSSGDGFFEKAGDFFGKVFRSPWMIVWLIFQLGLFVSRGVQLAGLAGGVMSDLRPATILIAAASIAILVVSVGFGNPRYRNPLEPQLILLTLIGFATLREGWDRWRRLASKKYGRF